MISGITLIRNGNLLNYPWKLCVRQLGYTCDEIIVNCDPGEDDTLQDLKKMAIADPRIKVVETKWNMANTGDGRELAIQAAMMLPLATQPWTLYLQADELIHQKDALALKFFAVAQESRVTEIELYRTYFWENINQRVQDEEIYLGRLFRTGTHSIGGAKPGDPTYYDPLAPPGDGMYTRRFSGDVVRSPFWIYHYSRVGNEQQVTSRIRSLDKLFHPEDEVKTYKPFNYANAMQGKRVIPYVGTHPQGVKEFYDPDTNPRSGWVC